MLTGEITVEVDRPRKGRQSSVSCVITDDSETYIDEKFSSVEDVRIGDRISLIGYLDPSPRLRRFVVSYARIRRSPKSPAVPDFIRAAIRDAQRAEEP